VTRAFRACVLAALILAPRAALACPVCFGNSDAPMAVATNNGVLFMLGVIAVVLSAFAAFIVNLMRRANRAAKDTATGEAGRFAPSQGSAQC
jgi:hypothetical protein